VKLNPDDDLMEGESKTNPLQRIWLRFVHACSSSLTRIRRQLRPHEDHPLDEPASIDVSESVVSESTLPLATSAVDVKSPSNAKRLSKNAVLRSPQGNRWAISDPSFDLSGTWDAGPFVTEEFKREYDTYMTRLGQPALVRAVAANLISFTTEQTVQSDQGRVLYIRGTNARGIWERTLVASGNDLEDKDSFEPIFSPILTPQNEAVQAEAWWEDQGTVHRSWLRGLKKYGGGSFESKRYLENDGNVYVCESTFHPDDPLREKAFMKWKFLRQGSSLPQ
jgi:hypothetical protein